MDSPATTAAAAVIRVHQPKPKSIADRTSRPGFVIWGDGCTGCGWSGDNHPGHVAAAVLEVLQPEVITTQERLDELPFLSVIREVFRNSPSGANYGGLYERRTSGWHCVAGAYKDSPDNGTPKLPCRVLWNPTEEQK